ncbi:hypothetical protein ACH42_00785 [Endozoicomonas sp. (ex Bugula neritina AB1)]|nr:hypothetical protein ACH42_00785 [Endozoicomonas sp. (ex Bugula neritina AB1)]
MKERHSVHIEEATIVGGTHGNEYLGPYFIRKIEEQGLYQDNSLKVSTLLANPEAFAQGIRFIDTDLNRSFTSDVLGSDNNVQPHEHVQPHEQQLARKINSQLNSERIIERFIIDLHSTTANMGITLIVRDDQTFNLHAASYVQQNIPEARILISNVDTTNNSKSLMTISNYGLTVEIGPIANGVIRQDLFETTEKVVSLLVKFLTLCTTREEPRLPDAITVYKARERVAFPRTQQGDLTGMVHKDLQDRDYRLLESGSPIFHSFNNQDIFYEGEPGYTVFINEAAYYREDIAFIITDKISISIPNEP